MLSVDDCPKILFTFNVDLIAPQTVSIMLLNYYPDINHTFLKNH